MRKVSILTFFGVANFGAWAQAYALNKVIQKINDKDITVEHIAYLEKSHSDIYYKHDIRLKNAFTYSWDEITHTAAITGDELEKKEFDILCIGSDAVWELNPAFDDDMHLFGEKIHAGKLFSYAASFGNIMSDSIPPNIQDVDFLKFEDISVRDDNSSDIIKKLTGKTPQLVADPVLLHDFKSDKNVRKTSFEKYILVYGVQWTDEYIYNARKYAKEHGLKLISAGYTNNWCDISLRLVELRGMEWIGLFENADRIYTSTFHGLMLGLNYGKDVTFCQVDYVKNRSQTLIEKLDIKNEIFNFNKSINYCVVSETLELMRKESIEYLKKNIL